MKNSELILIQILALSGLVLACTFSSSQAAINNEQATANRAGCYYFQLNHTNSLYSNPLASYIYNEPLMLQQKNHRLPLDFTGTLPLLNPGSSFIQGKKTDIKLIDTNLMLKSFAQPGNRPGFSGHTTANRPLSSTLLRYHKLLSLTPLNRGNFSTLREPIKPGSQQPFQQYRF